MTCVLRGEGIIRTVLTLTAFFVRRSLEGALATLLSPLIVAVTAITILPRMLSEAYGRAVALSILSGYIPLLAILASLPLAMVAVIESSSGALAHLLLAPVTPLRIATARVLSLTPFTVSVVLVGVALSETLYGFPPPKDLGVLVVLTIVGSLGVTGTVLTASHPFRNPQFAGIVASALVILFEYLSPVYYPASALPVPLRQAVLTLNPLATLMEYLRGNLPLSTALLTVPASATPWLLIGVALLARRMNTQF